MLETVRPAASILICQNEVRGCGALVVSTEGIQLHRHVYLLRLISGLLPSSLNNACIPSSFSFIHRLVFLRTIFDEIQFNHVDFCPSFSISYDSEIPIYVITILLQLIIAVLYNF